MTNKKTNRELEQEIVEADRNWNDYLTEMEADTFGLTVEQYREWRTLKTNEEMDAYIRKHSTKDWLPESGQGRRK